LEGFITQHGDHVVDAGEEGIEVESIKVGYGSGDYLEVGSRGELGGGGGTDEGADSVPGGEG